MMRKNYVFGNWKMNGNRAEVCTLLDALLSKMPLATNAIAAVFPPAIYLAETERLLSNTKLSYGAQNIYPADSGAYTGELSPPMVKEYGCQFVLVGHSERRHLLHEDEKFVVDKFHKVKVHGMIPVLCVGETLSERQSGQTKAVISRQLEAIASQGKESFKNCIVAYEPVWAIGTGHTATPEEAQEIHAFIRAFIAAYDEEDANSLSILYGGSVNEKNAASLFLMPDIDGGLVGGASLKADLFVEILKCIK